MVQKKKSDEQDVLVVRDETLPEAASPRRTSLPR